MSLGVTELVLILIIVFVIFGAGKLPNVMKDVGKSIKNLKDGIKENDLKENISKKDKKNNTK
jgi:sec-independent protein translocase protein TatA